MSYYKATLKIQTPQLIDDSYHQLTINMQLLIYASSISNARIKAIRSFKTEEFKEEEDDNTTEYNDKWIDTDMSFSDYINAAAVTNKSFDSLYGIPRSVSIKINSERKLVPKKYWIS